MKNILLILIVAFWWFILGFLASHYGLLVKGNRTVTFTTTPPENGKVYLLNYQYQFEDDQNEYWKKSYDVVSFYDDIGWNFGKDEMDGKTFTALRWAEIEDGWEGVMEKGLYFPVDSIVMKCP